MTLHKFAERQVGFEFDQSTKASAAHCHVVPVKYALEKQTTKNPGRGELCRTQEFRTNDIARKSAMSMAESAPS
jgi:hypothetical protein